MKAARLLHGDRMEQEACVSRLLMARINDTYAALGELVESIETIQKLFVRARKPGNEQYQEHDLENAREQGKDMGERLLKVINYMPNLDMKKTDIVTHRN